MIQMIQYPYTPDTDVSFKYVTIENPHMKAACNYAYENSLDRLFPTGTVLVQDGKIITQSANGTDYHKNNPCVRRELNVPSGTGYELCEGCHSRNHAELRSSIKAKKLENFKPGGEMYLWGHWWACDSCWAGMLDIGIKTIYLLENSEVLFNNTKDGNLIDANKQFEHFKEYINNYKT